MTPQDQIDRDLAQAEHEEKLCIADALKKLARYYSGDRNFPVALGDARQTALWLVRQLVEGWVR